MTQTGRTRQLVAALVLYGAGVQAAFQTSSSAMPEADFSAARAFIQSAMEEQKVPGVAISVVRNGRILWKKDLDGPTASGKFARPYFMPPPASAMERCIASIP